MNLRFAVALAVAAAVAACSSPQAAQTSGTAAPAASAAAPSLSVCTIYAQQHDAQIAVSPGDQAECNELIKDLAGGDAFWSYTPNGQALSDLQQACDMTSPDGTYEAVVMDVSGGFIGQDVCSGMASSGWTTSQTPGPLAQQIAQEAGQQQQAQASASASAAQAQQVANLQSSLQSDVSTLAQDAASLDNDNSLATDVQGMKNDVAAGRWCCHRTTCPAPAGARGRTGAARCPPPRSACGPAGSPRPAAAAYDQGQALLMCGRRWSGTRPPAAQARSQAQPALMPDTSGIGWP